MAIVLIGFMGAGKSTAARELGAALGQEVFDSDELLAARFGHSIAEEFALNGEDAFRAAEEELVLRLLDDAGPQDVIALGGGSVLSRAVSERLSSGGHVTVLLEVDPDAAWARAGGNGGAPERPLATDRERFRALHSERAVIYEQLAQAVVAPIRVERFSEMAQSLRVLQDLPTGTRLIWASTASADYPVLIGDGLLLEHGPALLSRWPIRREQSRPFCVTDASVGPQYVSCLGDLAGQITVPAGEAASKTVDGAQKVWDAMVHAELTRADHLIALGGGVIGDLAGFCAATFQRGIPVVQVPTTVVAQVDSAYGGKTGVDLPEAKNYVGVYHQPLAVLVDPAVLRSLPKREAAAGWVEVLKTAVIAGGRLWDVVSSGADLDDWTIYACARTKLALVAEDERDGGRRQVLNLGHTVGHAIETATGYGVYSHGEAIGLGLLAALRLSGRSGLRDQVEEMLDARGLPSRLKGANVDDVLDALKRDKKRLGDEVPFVLVDAPGEVSEGHLVPREQVRAAVRELAS